MDLGAIVTSLGQEETAHDMMLSIQPPSENVRFRMLDGDIRR